MTAPPGPPLDTDPNTRAPLRARLRALRASLPPTLRAAAAHSIATRVGHTPWLQRSRTIGLYVSVGSEVSTLPLRRLAAARSCPIYLPRIIDYRQRRMVFARAGGALIVNRFGIPEPGARQTIPPPVLSVVFVPVLAFDRHGTRLGSGAGFYDRVFSFCRRQRYSMPLLVGLAYASQELPYIEPRAHDVPLDAVVTEQRIHFCSLARTPSDARDRPR